MCNEDINREPTEREISEACLCFRHDYGLMDKAAKESLRFHAREWLIAWKKAFNII